MPIELPSCFKYLNKPKRYKGAYGGRGSGKSWGFADMLLLLGTMQPMKILCGREYQASINDSVKSLLDDTIYRRGYDNFYDTKKTEIIGGNGTRFTFLGLRHDPQKVKSMEGIDIFWGEEANTITQESLDILIPTIRKENSELWFSYNRKLVDEPVHALADRPDAQFELVNYPDNPFFPEVLRKEMEYDKETDYEKYLHIWEGEPQQLSDAMVFKGKFTVQPFETPPDAIFRYGADWGFSKDPTALVRCFIDGRRLYIDQEAYGLHTEIDDTPALFDTVPGTRQWKITADSARPETISYMQRHGFRIEHAAKGKDSVNDGVEFMRSHEIICHPRCKHTAYELGTYQYKTDRLTGEVLPILEDKNNHFIDSVRYALEGDRKNSTFMVS